MRYRRELVVTGDPDAVFAYLADFANAADWDPGILEARRLSDPPTTNGSRFEVIALFRGKRQRFEYVVTLYDEQRRVIALHGEGEKALSDDLITVSGVDGRTLVAYEAELRLKGIYRIAEPFLRSTIARLGDEALDGLATTLGGSG
jgi:carbon monoxide dehydrogenase subunit G